MSDDPISELNGILLVDKPLGISSFKVCDMIKKKFKMKKIGHGGTLDPQATGLLVILIGRATRCFDQYAKKDKVYEGSVILGESRDTQDSVGKVTASMDLKEAGELATDANLEKVRETFLGEQIQEAPIYSALKHKGKPLYHYARNNIAVESKKRKIRVGSFDIKKISPNEIEFRAEVSSGTYLRTIAHEFGERLGTHGYLGSLRRTLSGDMRIEEAKSLEEVLRLEPDELKVRLISIETGPEEKI